MSEDGFTFGGSDESSDESSDKSFEAHGDDDVSTDEDKKPMCSRFESPGMMHDDGVESLCETLDETRILSKTDNKILHVTLDDPHVVSEKFTNMRIFDNEVSEADSERSVVLCSKSQPCAKTPLKRKPKVSLTKSCESKTKVSLSKNLFPDVQFDVTKVFAGGQSDARESAKVLKKDVHRAVVSFGSLFPTFDESEDVTVPSSSNVFESSVKRKKGSGSEEESDRSSEFSETDFSPLMAAVCSTPKSSVSDEMFGVKPRRKNTTKAAKTPSKFFAVPHTFSSDCLKENSDEEFLTLHQQLLSDVPFESLTLNGKAITSVLASDQVKPCKAEKITSRFFMMRKLPSQIRIFGVANEDIDYRIMTRSSMQVYKNGIVIETKYLSDLLVPLAKKPGVNTSEADANAFLFFNLWNLPTMIFIRDDNNLKAWFKVIACVYKKQIV